MPGGAQVVEPGVIQKAGIPWGEAEEGVEVASKPACGEEEVEVGILEGLPGLGLGLGEGSC